MTVPNQNFIHDMQLLHPLNLFFVYHHIKKNGKFSHHISCFKTEIVLFLFFDSP